MIKGGVRALIVSILFTIFLEQEAHCESGISCSVWVKRLTNASSNRRSLEIGDEVEISLKANGGSENTNTTFLGLSVWPDGSRIGAFFFEAEKMEVHFVPAGALSFQFKDDQSKIDQEQIGLVTSSFNQQGGTCAAYAIFNCFHQLLIQNEIGTGLVVRHFETEMARQRFFTRVNTDYYSDGDHRGTETSVAEELGFQIDQLDTRGVENLEAHIQEISKQRWPAIIYFDVGEKMSTTPYQIIHHGRDGEISDRRLWLPNDGRSTSRGGHEIVLVRQITDTLQRKWLLVVDSNWQAPRLWSFDELKKLYTGRIGGWAVWQKNPNPSSLPPAPKTPFVIEPELPGFSPPPNF